MGNYNDKLRVQQVTGRGRRLADAARQVVTNPTWALAFLTAMTVLFLAIQIRDLRQSMQGQTYQSITDQMLQLDLFFFEHPEHRKYFYGKVPLLDPISDEDREHLEILAEWICDFFDNVRVQKNAMPRKTYDEWRAYMVSVYQNSAVIREFLETKRSWYAQLRDELNADP